MKHLLLLLLSLCFASPLAAGQAAPESAFPALAEKRHRELIPQLTADQQKALAKVYPGFRLVSVCPGNFSGQGSGAGVAEKVLGVWKPLPTSQAWKSPVHRVGLIWGQGHWEVHLIDEEIEKDASLSHSFPMKWQYQLDAKGFAGPTKCGVRSEFRPGSDLTGQDKPFFDLKQQGLARNQVICFATDDVYNNWDCLVYSPKDKRFRLWYQQVHAD